MDSGSEPAVKDLLENMPAIIEHNYVYRNNGDLTFEKTTDEWGLSGKSLSNGAAYADLDNDGDLDLIVNNTDQEAMVYRNNSDLHTENHFIKVQLKGVGKNTSAIGSKIMVKLDTLTLYQELYPVRGFQSSVDPSLVFGLGPHETIDEIQIIWPDGSVLIEENVSSNQTLVFEQDVEDESTQTHGIANAPELFIDITKDSLLNHTHVENSFNDFDREALLLHKLSTQGPNLATADINGDGLTDIYIGGAKNQAGAIYIQQQDGHYEKHKSFSKDAKHEDIGAVFFDANGDSRLDLYVASGGNEENEGHENYKDRLYINRGNGVFEKRVDFLPDDRFSSSCVVPGDIDMDGDIDLFIGGRMVPGEYPSAPESKVYINDGRGVFTDSSKEVLGKNAELGMVTDAIWNDFNNDGTLDLIVLGEFMPIRFFSNTNGKLTPLETVSNPKETEGWWNTIEPVDIDNDDDMDFVVGNFGLNSQIKASIENPVTLFAKDFDNNGSLDPILCTFYENTSYPIFSRDDMASQLNFIKEKYPNYKDYANQSIHQIFGKDQLSDAIKLEAHNFKSVVLRNKGNNQFEIESLPKEVQLAPVYSIISFDIDGDKDQDLILFGNFFDTRSRYGRYDANHGLVLVNDGKGQFGVMDQSLTGMNIMGQIRDAQVVKNADNETYLVLAQNNGPILLYKWQNK